MSIVNATTVLQPEQKAQLVNVNMSVLKLIAHQAIVSPAQALNMLDHSVKQEEQQVLQNQADQIVRHALPQHALHQHTVVQQEVRAHPRHLPELTARLPEVRLRETALADHQAQVAEAAAHLQAVRGVEEGKY